MQNINLYLDKLGQSSEDLWHVKKKLLYHVQLSIITFTTGVTRRKEILHPVVYWIEMIDTSTLAIPITLMDIRKC